MSCLFVPYQRVRIVTDRFAAERAPRGSVGYIIECYQDEAYEVEVSNPDTGETITQFVANAADLEAAPET
jgi:hypothetical protein